MQTPYTAVDCFGLLLEISDTLSVLSNMLGVGIQLES